MEFAIGVDIGGTNIKIGVVDPEGRVRCRSRLNTNPDEPSQTILTRLAKKVVKWSREYSVRVLGVGVAGLVDCRSGLVIFSPNLPRWTQTPVKDILVRLTGLDVFCANDADAVAIGEWLFGAAQNCRDALVLTLGTGVGSGIIANNQPVFGANFFAGELGHTVVSLHGPACSCGNNGCLESYVNARALVRNCRRLLRQEQSNFSNSHKQLALFPPNTNDLSRLWNLVGYDLKRLTPREIGKAAKMGDRIARRVIGEMGFLIGIGVYNAIMVLDPEIVVIGGGLSGLGLPLLQAVKTAIFSRTYLGPRKVKVVLSQLREKAGILGASQLNRFIAKDG